ncbi:YybH family protein [Sphingomonas sp. CFBP 13733]|uniref:YybH family protein n=1 Tax=Sphingomonas sp. CFBP 13733 TaxID=2775291 RepID=UPI001781032A|nr:nuclear transport factor 2 family protein [Sphingomonas sp. CFBP 13733]MBD8641158.1 nuclear transport factor 2 family protein [Sphingomonas sp. CFBP 13733]
MIIVVAAATAVTPVLAAPDRAPASVAIREAMAASAAGWNAGDLARFVAVYAEDAVFVTPKGLVRGKAAITARYAPSFTDAGNTRGRLSFVPAELRGIDPTHALLVARWTLTGATSTETGMTTLLFERRGDAWKIVADHSS